MVYWGILSKNIYLNSSELFFKIISSKNKKTELALETPLITIFSTDTDMVLSLPSLSVSSVLLICSKIEIHEHLATCLLMY